MQAASGCPGSSSINRQLSATIKQLSLSLPSVMATNLKIGGTTYGMGICLLSKSSWYNEYSLNV